MDRPPSSPPGKKPGNKRQRQRRKSPRGAVGVPERVRIAQRSLADAVRAAYADMFGEAHGTARPFSFSVEFRVDPRQQWRIETVPPLEERIRSSLQEMEVRHEAFQQGRVYCYRCESSLCEHSVPPGPGSVFGGYTSTGRPSWPDFLEVLLEHRHPGVDLLYEDQGHDLAVLFMAPDLLRHRQLAIFGRESKTYDILGQIVFGFLEMGEPGGQGRETERVAFSLQAVVSRGRNRSPRLELNVLGRLSGGRPAMDAVQGPFQTRVFHVVASARRTLQTLDPFCNGRGTGTVRDSSDGRRPEPAVDFLKKLARTLQKVGRQRGRRTTHAEDRRVTRRHTSSALRDVESAADDLFLWDEQHRTVVVVGPKNRVHVFSPDARHVTSLLLQSDEVKSRLRRRRWVPLSGEGLQRFRRAANRTTPPAPRNPPPSWPQKPPHGVPGR